MPPSGDTTTLRKPEVNKHPDWIHPLDYFYELAGNPLPEVTRVTELPEPYRQLLDHANDMTPTLEMFHGQTIHIQALQRTRTADAYYRQVLLFGDENGAPLEYGAIKINLRLFPESAQRDILQERLPLGRILHNCQLGHSSKPAAFLKIWPDDFITKALRLQSPQYLYGRRNTLYNEAGQSLAEIVEILPLTKER